MERKLGYYWVNAFDAWIIAEFTERFEWFACGSEEDISDEIKEIADYIGCDGSTLNEAKAILPINIVSNNEVTVCGLELRSCDYIGFSNRCNYAHGCPHKEQTDC